MELQKSNPPSETYTDAEQQDKRQIIRLIFPLSHKQSPQHLLSALKEHFNPAQHTQLLISHAFKSHHSTASLYRQFIVQNFPNLNQPQLSAYYQTEFFPDLAHLSIFRDNPSSYSGRHVPPLEPALFQQLDRIFIDYGYIPSLERFFTFFPQFLIKLRNVENQLFENSQIDQQTTFFLGLSAAAQMGCPYMINRMAIKFLAKGGKIQWVQNKKYPSKIASILPFNRKLARCIWDISNQDFEQIIQGGYWNANQLAFIIQILSYVHSICLITLGLGLHPQQKNSLFSTQKIESQIKEYRNTNIEINEKPNKKPMLKQVLSVLKVIIEEMKSAPQVVQAKVNPKRSFRKERKGSDEEESSTIEASGIEQYMKEIGTELTEQKLVSKVLSEVRFLPEYYQIQKRKDNKNNQLTCVDFNFEFMACPRLQSFSLVGSSTKKILWLIKQSEEMGNQNFGSVMVGSTKEFRRAQRYYAQNLCGFKHPEYDYERLMNKILPMGFKFYIRLLALSPLHMKRQVLEEVNHDKGQVELFDLGHTAILIAVTKLKLALTFTTYYFDF